ncbi:MAG: glycosyltransferase [Verrucomicrobiota bacterium]
MSRFRIMRMITWLPRGGIERKIAAVLPRLDRDLFEVHLCCIRERGPLADEVENAGIPVHVVPFRGRLDPFALMRLHQLVSRLKIDLVHAHMYRSNTPATALKLWNPRLTVLGHYHNVDTWESRRQVWMDKFLAHRRDLNLAVSDAVRTNVAKTLQLPPERIRTVYNCVDRQEFHPALDDQERLELREKLGLPTRAKLIMMVARLVRQKNQALAIQSMPEVLGEIPDAHLVIVGGGPAEQELKALTAALNLDPAVTFRGSRPDVAEILRTAHVSILPSLKEGFSNAVLESMASGVPMVASDVGGNREIIDQGANGFLCDIESNGEVNATQFVRHVKRLLGDDHFRTRLSVSALVTIERFGLDQMVNEIQQLYLEKLSQRSLNVTQS